MAKRRSRSGARVPRSAKVFLGLAAGVLFAVGIYFGIEIGTPPPRPELGSDATGSEPATPTATAKKAEAARPEKSAPPPEATGATDPAEPRRRVALVIDDLGRSLDEVDALEGLGVTLNYAVLPFEVRTREVVAEAHRRGLEVLCHLPMEPKNDANPGPGALRLAMSRAELTTATRSALRAVAGAAGVNNHMGSGFTPDAEAMATVLGVVRAQGLYYLDSRTSADTQGYAVAQRLGIPTLERQVFLDTERDPEVIRGQFAELVRRAEAGDRVVAIGHPYPETLEVLAAELPRAQERGIEFVRLSSLFPS